MMKKYSFCKNFQFLVDGDLHVVGCSKYDLAIFRKCLPVCDKKICDKCKSKTIS